MNQTKLIILQKKVIVEVVMGLKVQALRKYNLDI
jgi:hypothetical protein